MRETSESVPTFRCDLCDWTTTKTQAIPMHFRWHHKGEGLKHCPDCWTVLPKEDLPAHVAKHRNDLVGCASCGGSFTKQAIGGHRSICLHGSAFADPAIHAAAMATRSANPAYREHLSERMRGERNPMADAEVRGQMTATIQGKVERGEITPYGRRNYGNGGEPTPTEAAILERYPDAVPQYAVTMGDGELPYHYKLDAAWPSLRVGLDLDGSSHQTGERQKADARKDRRLASIGWSILRVPNEEALSSTTESWLSKFGITPGGSTTSK